MTLVRVEAPAVLAVDEDSMWAHLKLPLLPDDSSPVQMVPEDRQFVRQILEGAIAELDGADGLLSRCLIRQTWRLTLDVFPRCIDLPLPPLQAVEAVEYVAAVGESPEYRTLPTSAYRVAGVGDRWMITAATSWPSTTRVSEAVRVTFAAGYGDSPDDVPPQLRQAILEAVALRYDFPTGVSVGAGMYANVSASSRAALDNLREWAF